MFEASLHRVRAALLALVLGGVAAATAQPVTWQTPWRVGDHAKYEVTQERKDEREGRADTQRVTQSELVVRVLPPTAGQSGRRLGWRRTLKDAPTLSAAQAERAPALAAFLRNAPEAILRADDDGLPEAVENLDEITAQAKRVAGDLAPLAQLAASAPALAAMVQELVSPAVVQSALLSEGNSLLGYAGVEFTPGKTLEVAQDLPNPLGGPNFPAVTRVRMLEHDAKARLLRIEARTTLDPAKARVALAQTLERMGQRLGKPLPPGAITRVDIDTLHTIDIDLNDGWPTRARTQRQIEIVASDGVARRVDTSVFVRRR